MRLNLKSHFQKVDRVIFVALLSFFIIFLFSQKTVLSSSDLGRHLENGRIIWQEKSILKENFYSYTEPEHRFINHHWLFGVFVYQIYSLGGFTLLTILNILLALIIFWLFFYLAYKKSNFFIASLISLPAVLLMGERAEIRPEMFSVLYLIILWLILEAKNWTNKKKIISIFIIFLLWVNTHIYFFLGFALVALYCLASFIDKFLELKIKDKLERFKLSWHYNLSHLYLFISALVASLFNPNFIRGLLYPFNILRKYAYPVAENKGIFYLESIFFKYSFLITKRLILVLVISLLINKLFSKKHNYLNYLLSAFFIFLALIAQRNLAIFGLAALVLLSENVSPVYNFLEQKISQKYHYFKFKKFSVDYKQVFLAFLLIILFIFTYSDYKKQAFYFNYPLGWGLSSDNYQFIDFLENSPLLAESEGSWAPIFNNYDIGSALIFSLNEKVFADNRPEAYSVDFLENELIAMQENDALWYKFLEQYQFRSIIFSHNDGTSWGPQFIKRRLADKDWALVYVDEHALVLLRRDLYEDFDFEPYEINSWSLRQLIRQLSASKNNIISNLSLANLSLLSGFYDIYLEILQDNLRISSNNLTALFNLANNHIDLGDKNNLHRALEYLKRVKSKRKQYPGVYENLGLAYWNLGEHSLAEKVWRQGLKRDKSIKSYLEQIKDLRLSGELE